VRHCGTMIGLRPDITEAHVVRHGVLRLTFADDLVGEVDVLDRMHGLVFDTARTTSGFAHVSVDEETGTVTWPGARISRRTPSMSAFGPVCGRIRRVTSYCDGRRSTEGVSMEAFWKPLSPRTPLQAICTSSENQPFARRPESGQ